MPRLRLGVALVLPEPAATEVDGLRRALGDPALGRIVPHLTLVPPVNVRVDDLGTALRVVREAAASTTPFVVALGPVATFRPVNPVLYLGVAGDGGAEQVAALRQRVFRPPLARPHSHPFVPHVTLAAEAAPERIAAALVALGDYRVEVPVTGVTLLQEGPSPDRHWTTVADAAFGPLATVGRGGLPVDLWRSTVVDPEALALLGDQPPPPLPAGATGRVVTARRDGALLGVAAGWWRDGAPTLERLEVVAGELADVERHLLGAFDAVGPQPGGAEPTSSAGRWA